jgi:flagellar hook-associated protein 1 FlgK
MIRVDLLPGPASSTLESIAQALDAVDGISARSTLDGRLEIRSDSPDQTFAFADDTSGLLASLGLNTFFQGSSAFDIAVNPVVKASPATFASSLQGIGADTVLASRLAALFETPLSEQGSASLVGQVAENSSVARALAQGARVFEQTLRSQKLAISGVNLDEEAVRLIAFQRAFQASARYIATLSELFNLLVNI